MARPGLAADMDLRDEMSGDMDTKDLWQQIQDYNGVNLCQEGSEPLPSVNFADQLSDLRPTDWAFQGWQKARATVVCWHG